MLSQSPEVSRYDLSCLKILITGGGLLSATIRLEVMERIPTVKYVREVKPFVDECPRNANAVVIKLTAMR